MCEVVCLKSVSLGVISVELLNDARGVLYDLLVGCGRILSKWLDDATNTHLFKSPAALFVHTEVTDGEEGNTAWRLRRALVVSYDIQKLLEGSVADKILAESVGIADEVA